MQVFSPSRNEVKQKERKKKKKKREKRKVIFNEALNFLMYEVKYEGVKQFVGKKVKGWISKRVFWDSPFYFITVELISDKTQR